MNSKSARRAVEVFLTATLFCLIFSGCSQQSLPPTVIPSATLSTNTAQATDAPQPDAASVPFALAGTWSGTAVNGDISFSVTVTLEESCVLGGDCGTFTIPFVPCSGSYVLIEEKDNQYEFDITDKSATCGEGSDFLQLLPDGRLQFTSRGDYGENKGILTRVDPDLPATAKLQVIFDDDGSPDGTTALLYLMSDTAAEVKAVVISHGEAHPSVYIQHMGRMLENIGFNDIPLGYGKDSALVPGEDFPEWIREASDGFWGLPVPYSTKTYATQEAAKLLVPLLNEAPEPMAIFVSGPGTDLAMAMQLDPHIRENIKAVYMMGGAIYVPGNLTDFSANPSNVTAEWNIYIDPLATSQLFASGLPIILVPLDATNQVSATMADTSQWRAGGKTADLAADMYDMLLGGSGTNHMGLWDVMTAEIMVHPELCDLVPLHLEIVTKPGDTYGQMRVMANERPNTQVCLKPDIHAINLTLIQVFSISP
jgi:pyrimidine-specific ribonucleoside hydrolase